MKTDFFTTTKIVPPIMITALRIEAYGNKYIFEPLGLTASCFKIMAILHEKKKVSPIEMIEMLSCSKSNITQRLKYLEKKKMITKLYPKENFDKRKIVITLTDLGEKKFHEFTEIIQKQATKIEKFFTREEINNHIAFIKKLSDLIDKIEKKKSLLNIF